MENENMSLATEMLKELKENSKRWFKIALIELIIIISIVIIFIAYLNTPEEEITKTTSYTQDAETGGENSSITQQIGE